MLKIWPRALLPVVRSRLGADGVLRPVVEEEKEEEEEVNKGGQIKTGRKTYRPDRQTGRKVIG